MNKRLAPVALSVGLLGLVGGVAAANAFQPAERAPQRVEVVQPAAQVVTPTVDPAIAKAKAAAAAKAKAAKVAKAKAAAQAAAKKKAAAAAAKKAAAARVAVSSTQSSATSGTVQRQAIVSEPAPEPTTPAPAEPTPAPTRSGPPPVVGGSGNQACTPEGCTTG